MNLEEFVAESLTQIMKGVKKAQEELGELGEINPRIRTGSLQNAKLLTKMHPDDFVQLVDFDVAVTASEGTRGELGGGIKVFSGILDVGGKAGETTSKEDVSVSRIKFCVPLVLPRIRFRKENNGEQG
ncbi:MAG: hypothetical protein ACE5JS_17905 [Nitrospinota bacterium]